VYEEEELTTEEEKTEEIPKSELVRFVLLPLYGVKPQ